MTAHTNIIMQQSSAPFLIRLWLCYGGSTVDPHIAVPSTALGLLHTLISVRKDMSQQGTDNLHISADLMTTEDHKTTKHVVK